MMFSCFFYFSVFYLKGGSSGGVFTVRGEGCFPFSRRTLQKCGLELSLGILRMILGAFWNGGRQAFPGWDMEKKDDKKQEAFPLWHASIGQQKPISSGLLFFMQYKGDDSL